MPGLYEPIEDVDELLSEVSVDECRRLLESGIVAGGMAPKVEGILRAMEGGVRRAHVLDGRVPHALILELFTPEGLGTMVARQGSVVPRELA